MDQILYFTIGSKTTTRFLMDASAGRTIKIKTTEEIRELIKYMSQNDYNPQGNEETLQKGKEDKSLEENLFANNRLLRKQLEELTRRLEDTKLDVICLEKKMYK